MPTFKNLMTSSPLPTPLGDLPGVARAAVWVDMDNGEIFNLPEPEPGVVFIVYGNIAKAACRADVAAPDYARCPVGRMRFTISSVTHLLAWPNGVETSIKVE